MFVIFLLVLLDFFSVGHSNSILNGRDVGRLAKQGKITNIHGHSEFPYMVHLTIIEPGKNNTKKECICGGVIISEDTVLTAGHCISNPIAKPEVLVKAGILHTGYEVNLGQSRWMKDYVLHDGYMDECVVLDQLVVFCLSDIAIIWLATPFVFGPKVQKAVLVNSDHVPVNKKGWILGWGLTEAKKVSNMLQKAEMRVISHSDCQKLAEDIVINDDVLCLLSDSKLSGTCDGDSGGPFVLNGQVYGISSFSFQVSRNNVDECDPSRPEIYTNVGDYYEWINEKLGERRKPPQPTTSVSTNLLNNPSTSSGRSTISRKRPGSSDVPLNLVKKKILESCDYD